MKFGCCTGIDKYYDLVNMGYDYIDLEGAAVYKMTEQEFENTRQIIMEGPIKCYGFNAFVPPEIKLVGDIDKGRIDEYIDKVVYRAGALGVEAVNYGSPLSRNIPDGFSREKAVEQTVEFLNTVLDRAAVYGIKVLVEPVTSSMTNFINTVDEALEIVKLVKNDNIGVLIDLYHLWAENEDISVINAESVKYLHHTHIAEEMGRTYLISSNKDKYKLYIDRLKSLGYNGTLSIEGLSKDFKSEALESIKILREIDPVSI